MFENTLTYKNALDNAILQSDIVAIFDNLLTISVEEWASDIHIEPMENYSRIRIRIDWLLQELVQYPKTLHESIISKFKIGRHRRWKADAATGLDRCPRPFARRHDWREELPPHLPWTGQARPRGCWARPWYRRASPRWPCGQRWESLGRA